MILLFGGDGQLGREMRRTCAARGVALAALSRAQGDITDPAAIRDAIARHNPSVVVNAAAYTKVDQAETEIEAAHRGNVLGPGLLAKACAAAGVPLIHLSTDYVFDGTKKGAYVEGDVITPVNAYGQSKADGEQAVRDATPQHVIIRTSWVYGEFGQNFLKTMIDLAATRDELRVVADQRGCPTSTPDIADALLSIAPQLRGGKAAWGTYHFTGAGVTTWHAFASRIVASQAPLTGRAPRVTPITTAEFPRPARRPMNSELDCGLIARTFGVRGRPWTEEAEAITRAVVEAKLGKAPHVA